MPLFFVLLAQTSKFRYIVHTLMSLMIKFLAYIILLTIFLSGCIYSDNAYIPLEKAIEDPSFEGRYAEYKEGNDSILEIFNVSRKSEKVYLIEPEIDKEEMEVTAMITMIGKHHYVDISSYDEISGKLIHFLGKVITISDGFVIESMNVDYLTLDFLIANYNIEAIEQNGYIEITSSTEKLYKMIKGLDGDPAAFNNPVYYRKLK